MIRSFYLKIKSLYLHETKNREYCYENNEYQ